MVIVFKIIKKCSSCKKNYKLVDFRKEDKIFKQCIKCRNMKNKSKIKNMCIHNKEKYVCKDCGGGGICIHNRRNYECIDCNGGGVCIHNKLKSQCVDCGGSRICQHNKQRSCCMDCGGSSICQHNRQKHNCKLCGDPIDITIKNMINHSKRTDKLLNIFDETNFVDYPFLKNLIDNSNDKCFYCYCNIQYTYYNHTLGTIERLNNSIGHIKSNCVIACKNCNLTRVGSRTNPQG